MGPRCWQRIANTAMALAIGSRAVAAQPPTIGAPPPRPTATTISGVVYDSIAHRPIPGVTVEFVSADNPATSQIHLATADSSGRYSIRDIPVGSYIGGFFHPALDSLGLASIQRLVEVRGASQRVDFASPSIRTVMGVICGAGVRPDSTGLLLGHIRRTDTERPITGATAVIEWGELVMDATGIRQFDRSASVRSGETGWFAMCGVPTEAVLHARAISGSDLSGYVEVEIPPGELRHVTFLVGGAVPAAIGVPDSPDTPARAPSASQAAPVWRGAARLTGAVVDVNSRPVASAHVLVWGTGIDVITNERGEFAMDSLPGGTQTLEVRVIGYVPVRRTIHLAAGRPARSEVRLEKTAMLSTVTVRGTLMYSRQLADFDRRRRSGFGTFLTSSDIDRLAPSRLSDVLRTVPGVQIDYSNGRPRALMRGGAMTAYCTPTLYVDGVRDISGDFEIFRSDELVGVEVYNRDTARPAEFSDMSGCGAIAIWTRQRMPRPKKE